MNNPNLSADINETDGDNYRYWRENGQEWAAEYDKRKKQRVYYHIQELMLADYLRHLAPARVLEFGCGVGRHLRYASRIPGIDIYGYDQSPTMTAAIHTWSSPDWFREHIVVGEPVGRLPYPDQHFDLVYTSEVLIHVAPADLLAILKELIRISRRQILHIEPAPHMKVVSDDHFGCWNHDLIGAYESLGLRCEILASGFDIHAPYRVVLDPTQPVYNWPAVQIGLMRRLEADIEPTIQTGRHAESQLKEVADQVNDLRARLADVEESSAIARRRVDELETVLTERTQDLTRLRSELDTSLHDIKVSATALANAETRHQIQLEEERKQHLTSLTTALNSPVQLWGRRFRQSAPARWMRRWRWGAPTVSIRAVGQCNPLANGAEVWLLAFRVDGAPRPVHVFEYDPEQWKLIASPSVPFGLALVAQNKGQVVFYSADRHNMILEFLAHPYSGHVMIEAAGSEPLLLDLYAATPTTIAIDPRSKPATVYNIGTSRANP